MNNSRLIRYMAMIFLAISLTGLPGYSQDQGNPEVIDQVICIIGNKIILHSDIEIQYIQYRSESGIEGSESTVKCTVLKDQIFQKLLLNQAELDSVKVSDAQVESELDRRLRYYIAQFGSQEKFEEFYQKSIVEFKDEFRSQVKDQLMMETVKNKINEKTRITPTEIKTFFNKIPADSLPMINSEIEISHLVKIPAINPAEETRIRAKLTELRDRVLKGEDLATLAILYSEDEGSAKNGGELGYHGRGEFYPEFEAVAFKIEKGTVSDIVKTPAGFHIIQLIEKKGEYVNSRHILLKPKALPLDLALAKKQLDSISTLIDKRTYTFEEAVKRFSDDPSKNNNGLLINPITGTTFFEADQLDPKVFFVIDKLEPGEISAPVSMKTDDGKEGYRILRVNRRTNPHVLSLREDYDKVQQWALEAKKAEVTEDWIREKLKTTYVRIINEYHNCPFVNDWSIRTAVSDNETN